MPRELKLQWREIPLARRGKDCHRRQLCARRGADSQSGASGDRVMALDVKGKRMSTEQLARQLQSWQMSGDNYSVLIGGPDGSQRGLPGAGGYALVAQ